MRFLAIWETGTSSLNEYWQSLIFLYVFLTSDVSKGGLPYSRANLN